MTEENAANDPKFLICKILTVRVSSLSARLPERGSRGRRLKAVMQGCQREDPEAGG